MDNRMMQWMPSQLINKLTDSDLRAIGWLNEQVSNSDLVHELTGGYLFAEVGRLNITLDVVSSLANQVFRNPHMELIVGINGLAKPFYSVCMLADLNNPAADSYVSWVRLIDSGFPAQTPDTLIAAIDDANDFISEHELSFQLADDCAQELILLTKRMFGLQEKAKSLYQKSLSDSMTGDGITLDLLMRTLRVAAACITAGIDVNAVNVAISPFLMRYSLFTVNAAIRHLKSTNPEPKAVVMAEILVRFKGGLN
jgi:hypothetical protein